MAQKLADDIKAYRETSDKLSPRDASTQWLALYDRASAVWLQGRSGSAAMRGQVDTLATQLMVALPRPARRRELETAIDARLVPADADGSVRHLTLRLAAALLAGNGPEKPRSLQELRDAIATGNDAVAGQGAADDLTSLERLVGEAAEPRGSVAMFEKEIELLGDDPEQDAFDPRSLPPWQPGDRRDPAQGGGRRQCPHRTVRRRLHRRPRARTVPQACQLDEDAPLRADPGRVDSRSVRRDGATILRRCQGRAGPHQAGRARLEQRRLGALTATRPGGFSFAS
ncbi:MAG: hypothetical protein QM767_01920 [Anaeromyxobacter sp.]